jgi:hypothetical protein
MLEAVGGDRTDVRVDDVRAAARRRPRRARRREALGVRDCLNRDSAQLAARCHTSADIGQRPGEVDK